ncbi:hypothetical protein FF011L_27850 [Roseimaritima multifibrata]|uniref:Uncharacterized protein n=1 Tax=Roseimaritima multifibrata TaxID=1930274 RepID=A0A517MGJ8_9BACT|nr:hypothetical protein [Roseimaritima multifibrata]QDS94008.1 hypothetical protein FF011L_27850 [Roseimaritima multifibrata]
MNTTIRNRRSFIQMLGLSLAAAKTSWSDEQNLELMKEAPRPWQQFAIEGHVFEHWTPEEEGEWKWYRLERFLDEEWQTVGISLPKHRESGEAFEPSDGYVSPEKIPTHVIENKIPKLPSHLLIDMEPSQYDPEKASERTPDPIIQGRDGKPPSEWLLSLTAEELRDWLQKAESPGAAVRGMTCWVHLVRDHGFDPRRIEGLSPDEFTLLHSAAHYGY